MQKILDLQNLRQIRQHFDYAKLWPRFQRKAEDGKRALHVGIGRVGRDAQLVREPLEAHVVMVFFHRYPAAEPFGVWRWRERNRGLVEDLCAIELVDGVAHDNLRNRLAVLRWLARQ